jgi:probable HAF family extracellular repeat protein
VVGISETARLDTLGQAWSCSAFFPSVTGHTCLGFAWRNGVMTPMPTLGGQNSFATAANDRGVVVGWAETAVHDPTCDAPQVLQFRAVAWRPATGQLRQLKPLPGDSTSAATGINRHNQVIGISGRCGVAVGMFSAQHAAIWENGAVRNLGDLGGTSWQTPMAINDSGDVVGFSNPPGDSGGAFIAHAVRWPKGGAIQDLGLIPGDDFSQALGINIHGQIVGLSCGESGCRALLWDNGRMIDLNTLVRPSGDVLYYAGDINDRGEITGLLIEAGTGEARAFIARPIG